MKKITIFIFSIILSMSLTSCGEYVYYLQEKTYYEDDDNYMNFEGVIEEIYDEGEDEGIAILKITVSENSQYLTEDYFKLIHDIYEVVYENGFFTDVAVGDTVSFVAAPEYFGDGYNVPIVALSKGETTYIDFTLGKKLLLDRYDSFFGYVFSD